MWTKIASIIIRQRLAILLVLGVLTAYMAFRMPDARLQYTYGGLLPKTDSTYLEHEKFLEHFGAEGHVMFMGVNDPWLKTADGFQAWYDLAEEIRWMPTWVDTTENGIHDPVDLPLVDSVFGLTHAFNVVKDTTQRRFELAPVVPVGSMEQGGAVNQSFVDSIYARLHSLPFFEGFLYLPEADSSDATLMMVFVDSELFNSDRRGSVVEDVTALTKAWSEEHGVDVHLSGLPFIRVEMTNKVKGEIGGFIGAAMLVTALLLLLFFRNPMVMGVCLVVVGTGVVWSIGTMAILDYPITLLMSLIPPLMIVIGVPNCIYLVNKYHSEFKRHGNKAMALQRMIVKVGNATLLTNFTTALGFAAFIFTHSDILKQFGVVAALNIVAVFFISIIIIPALMTWLPAPKRKHVRHLDRRWMFRVVGVLVKIIQHNRRSVYWGAVLVLLFSIGGIVQMQTTGNIVDDLPSDDRVIEDLQWIEGEFKGVMPFEILVDAGRPNGATTPAMMKRIERLQALLAEYPVFSRSVSAADVTKFGVQAFYGGDPRRYRLPTRQERSFIGPWFRGSEVAAEGSSRAEGVTANFLNDSRSATRVSTQMADVGTIEMGELMEELRPRVDSIFPADKYRLTYTGTCVVFLEGTNYMVKNLGISIALAILVIALIMSLLFRSGRMVLIALVPNLFPLFFTAGVMGWAGIPIKPSTILVFSVAFGISVDDTIHFLAKYRQELSGKVLNIGRSVIVALKETGISMMYTSIVLFFGFLMFAMSEFDGTRSLGLLVSITLLVAMSTNLLLLPSLLLGFERKMTNNTFKEPFFNILDEEEDIELEELEIRWGLAPGKGDEQHEDLKRNRKN